MKSTAELGHRDAERCKEKKTVLFRETHPDSVCCA
jgi:hypothetical protein